MNYADTAKEYALKFDFYFLALIFTILGLSVQTADFPDSKLVIVLELIGWLGLFVSGILGLLRMERFSLLYQNLYNRQAYNDKLSEPDKKKYDDFINNQEGYLQGVYAWQKWIFVFGFFCVMVSRAIEPIHYVLC